MKVIVVRTDPSCADYPTCPALTTLDRAPSRFFLIANRVTDPARLSDLGDEPLRTSASRIPVRYPSVLTPEVAAEGSELYLSAEPVSDPDVLAAHRHLMAPHEVLVHYDGSARG